MAAGGWAELAYALVRYYPDEQPQLDKAIEALLAAAEAGPYAQRQFGEGRPDLAVADLNGTLDFLPDESQVTFVNVTAALMFHGADGPRGTAAALHELLTTIRTKLGVNDGD
jgi:hypothetical protein